MTAAAEKGEKKGRGRRGRAGDKKGKKETAMVAAKAEPTPTTTPTAAATATATSPSAATPPAAAAAATPKKVGSAEATPKKLWGGQSAASGSGRATWTPPAGTRCNYCGADDHWMAQCPDRLQRMRGRGGGSMRPYQPRRYPPCPYCGRDNHPGERCWTNFPYLRQSARPPPPPPPPSAGVKQQANLVVAGATGSGAVGSERGEPMEGVKMAMQVASKWEHVAEPEGCREMVCVSSGLGALFYPSACVVAAAGDWRRAVHNGHHPRVCSGDSASPARRDRVAVVVPLPPEGRKQSMGGSRSGLSSIQERL